MSEPHLHNPTTADGNGNDHSAHRDPNVQSNADNARDSNTDGDRDGSTERDTYTRGSAKRDGNSNV